MMAGPRCLRLLTFDVTNTIIQVKGSPGLWYARAAARLGVDTEPTRLDVASKKVRRAMRTEFPHYGHAHGMTPKEWWAEYVTRVFPVAGYFPAPAVVDQIAENLHMDFTGGGCYDTIPGSHQMLKQLKELGLVLAVVSNFDERLGGVLQGHGLLGYFDFFNTSAMSKAEKPAPKIFQDALFCGQVAPHQAGHVGDDVTNDYWGAMKVGMRAFLFDPNRKLRNEDLKGVDQTCVFHDHSELVGLAKREWES